MQTYEPRNEGSAVPRVLLVDDEAALCVSIAMAMGDDYEIVCESCTESALERLEQDKDFRAILCDVNMPGDSGIVLYERVAERWPGLERRVVFMTGGGTDEKASQFLRNVPNSCLEKPFKISTLERMLEPARSKDLGR